jgi:hypothetical protein
MVCTCIPVRLDHSAKDRVSPLAVASVRLGRGTDLENTKVSCALGIRSLVRIRWQLAHTNSHFFNSSTMRSHAFPKSRATLHSALQPITWSVKSLVHATLSGWNLSKKLYETCSHPFTGCGSVPLGWATRF